MVLLNNYRKKINKSSSDIRMDLTKMKEKIKMYNEMKIININRCLDARNTLNVIYKNPMAYKIAKGYLLNTIKRKMEFEYDGRIYSVLIENNDISKFTDVLGPFKVI